MSNQGKFVKWKQNTKTENYILNLIQRGTALFVQGVDQYVIPANKKLEIDVYCIMLVDTIDLKGIESDREKRWLFFRALQHLRQHRSNEITRLSTFLDIEIEKAIIKKEQTWRIILPINLNRDTLGNRRWFFSSNIRLRIKNWAWLQKNNEVDKWLDVVNRNFPNDPKVNQGQFIPLYAEVKGRNYIVAFRKAVEAYDLLRAAVNWSQIALTSQLRLFSGRGTPLCPIPPSPTYAVFDENGNYANHFYTTAPAEKYDKINLSAQQYKVITKILGLFNRENKPNSVNDLIRNAFRTYQLAIDTNDWRQVYLNLWQIIELVTTPPNARHQGIRNIEITRRMKILLKDSRPYILELFDVLVKWRNKLVHHGEFSDDGEEDAKLLKLIVELAILKLINLRRSFFDWTRLEFYYAHATTDSAQIKTQKSVLGSIERRIRRRT